MDLAKATSKVGPPGELLSHEAILSRVGALVDKVGDVVEPESTTGPVEEVDCILDHHANVL